LSTSTIQFFANPTSGSAPVQGQTLLGSTSAQTDLYGKASFTFTTAVAIPSGQPITATDIDIDNNTSQFSSPVAPIGTQTLGDAGFEAPALGNGSFQAAQRVNKVEITDRGEYVVAADYRPVSILVEGKRESGPTRVTGRSRGSSFEVTVAYRKMDGRDVLMFPLGKEVGPPELLESLTVELKWRDISFERFRLEDDRQHVVERSREGDQYRVVVRIEAPKPLSLPARLPIAGPEFAFYLGESRYIKPHDERIIAVAREVTKGKTDALEAVKALSAWMLKNVEPTLIAETLTGPEVLACRKGKCSEFATLFASLARAAGIPTRIVLGERMILKRLCGGQVRAVGLANGLPNAVRAVTVSVANKATIQVVRPPRCPGGIHGRRWRWCGGRPGGYLPRRQSGEQGQPGGSIAGEGRRRRGAGRRVPPM